MTNGAVPKASAVRVTVSRERGFGLSSLGSDRLLAGIAAALVILLCVLPMLRLLMEALLPAADGSLPLQSLNARSVFRAGTNTLASSFAATVISTLLGGGLALLIGLTDIRRKSLLTLLCLLPLLIPSQITALAWIKMLDVGSPARAVIDLLFGTESNHPLYGGGGVSFVMGLEHAPLMFLAIAAACRALPCDLVEAARAAGASHRRVLFTIILPLLKPALLAGGALAFVSAIGNFGVPALLGIPGRFSVLTTLIYQRLNGFGPSVLGETAALGLVLALIAGIGLIWQRWVIRHAPALRTGGPTGPILPLGRARPLIELGTWLVLLLLTVVPLAALVGAALVPALGVPLTWETATLENFIYVLTQYQPTQRAFLNSTLLSAGAAVVTVLLGLVLAYYGELRRWRWMRALDAVADAPYAVPGIVLAIAEILVFLKPLPLLGFSLYGTAWILLVAYVARFLTLALRPLAAAMKQMDPTLEEAARLAGATGPRRLVSIVMPTVRASIMSGALLVFLTAFNELTVSALLWSRGHETLGVMVFSLQSEGAAGAAAAVASITVVVTLAVAGIATLFARRLPKGTLPWMP
jgi:iron(III) transport system permease protein